MSLVHLFGADHADLFDRGDITSDHAVGHEAKVVIHVTQTGGGHFIAIGVAAWGDDIGTTLKQRATGLLHNPLATLGQDLGNAKTALTAAHESLDLVEFARAEIAGLGIRVDDRVGDDAHAVLPRSKRSPERRPGPVVWGGVCSRSEPIAGSV